MRLLSSREWFTGQVRIGWTNSQSYQLSTLDQFSCTLNIS